jgi:glutamyl/glutaminyl-tRNA synthetase
MPLSHSTLASRVTSRITSRIAPTPSGYLHVGNAASFVLTWLIVRKHGGRLHLRIDDLDRDRVRTEYVQDVFDTLEWLGLDIDSGPRAVRDFEQHWSQRRRNDAYTHALEQLRSDGRLFGCQCSRTMTDTTLHTSLHPELHHTTPNGVYAGTCRDKNFMLDDTDDFQHDSQHPSQQPSQLAWRVRVPVGCTARFADIWRGEVIIDAGLTIGDTIVRRKDRRTAYHIASLTDDCLDGITFIVRGADLLASTAIQTVLAEMLCQTVFQQVVFLHHPLLTDSTGRKLSKSEGAISLKSMRECGESPRGVYAHVAKMLGLEPLDCAESLPRLLDAFVVQGFSL